MRVSRILALGASASLALATPRIAAAQQYFGQNQVQYRHFKWRVLETEHFMVHFYPEERAVITDAARMAERAYGRLSQILQHQFREKKPIILFASRADFGQNNVTGDLGEGVGGVTEGLRHRLIMPFTGDYASFEKVLTHEMVHEFQYDILSRGKAGANLQAAEQIDMPLWFMEGMAEYLSIGPDDPITNAVMRDAAVNGTVPTIKEMTQRPDKFFPYSFGEALFQYIGERWGDASIGAILQSAMSVGVERAFRRELGITLDQLSDEWKEAVQAKYLPTVANLQRPNQFGVPLLTPRRTRGEIFLAPALSSDGRYVAFLANGDPKRGDFFIDLWLGDAVTGKRIKKLVASTTNPNFEELRLLYSQSSFSNDGTRLAFTAQRGGKDVLYIIDVRNQNTIKRLDLPVDAAWSPSWSPDDRRLVFSGHKGGVTDIYVVDVDGRNLRQLTHDKFGDLQPSWSPDGKWIAFATERTSIDLGVLRVDEWNIGLLDAATGEFRAVPGQGGLNINPVWSPDGRAIAFVSDRTGIANLFLYDLDRNEHFQLTNVLAGVSSFTAYSPVITWARGSDRLAFTYYENGDYTVWAMNNPRRLRAEPFRPSASTVARVERAQPLPTDTARRQVAEQSSTYRAPSGSRPSGELTITEMERVETPFTVSALLADPVGSLPDTTRFKESRYKVRFRPDYIGQSDIGYTPNYYGGSGFAGGTTLVFSDLLSNHQIAVSAQVNGRIQDASFFAAYANLSRRFQYSGGAYIQPIFLPVSNAEGTDLGDRIRVEQVYARYVQRNAFLVGMYPLNRFTRFEAGAQFNSITRSLLLVSFDYFGAGIAGNAQLETIGKQPTLTYASPTAAFVTDNALFGVTGPLSGKRIRVEVTPSVGSVRKIDYLADVRTYLPIRLNTLTFATRALTAIAVGRDEAIFPKYIGRPDYVRGYDNANFFGTGVECNTFLGSSVAGQASESCARADLVGSRVVVANAELRFPIIRRFDLGIIGLPPLDGVLFYDAGLAWTSGQKPSLRRPDNFDTDLHRYALTSWGGGLRFNVFGYVILRWDYAVPMGTAERKPVWTFSLGPSF